MVKAILLFLALALVSPAHAEDHAVLLSRAKAIFEKKVDSKDCKRLLDTLPDKVPFDKVTHHFTTPPVEDPRSVAGWVYCRDGQRRSIFYNESWVDHYNSPAWLVHVMLHEYTHLRSCSMIESGLTETEYQAISLQAERYCLGHLRSDQYGREQELH